MHLNLKQFCEPRLSFPNLCQWPFSMLLLIRHIQNAQLQPTVPFSPRYHQVNEWCLSAKSLVYNGIADHLDLSTDSHTCLLHVSAGGLCRCRAENVFPCPSVEFVNLSCRLCHQHLGTVCFYQHSSTS